MHPLQKVALFAALSDAECGYVDARLKRREYPPQSIIVREGAPGDAMYIVMNGRVEVRKKDPLSGVEFRINELTDGQAFGEMALLTGSRRTATVAALDATECAILEQGDFHALLTHRPRIAIALTTILAERLQHANEHVGVDFVNLSRLQIDPQVLKLLPQSVISGHQVLPISFTNNRLTLAMTNPNNVIALDDVRRVLKGVAIEPTAITEDDFERFLAGPYAQALPKPEPTAAAAGAPARAEAKAVPAGGVDLLTSDIIRDLQLLEDSQTSATADVKDLMNASEDAPIIRLANSILGLAIKQGASDIHIEPMEQDVTVRFRIDGVLQVVQKLPKKVQLGLISRVKILSRLDIAEKRLPQDGRISVTLEGKPIDLRVSTVPGKWGEKICARLLDKSNTTLGLDRLITDPATLKIVRELVNQPHGIIYVTGPTGSGKTTTLYSALAELNAPGINICTVEDPIEYDLGGVTQIQVNKEIGLDFAKVLRAFLRQDPDVLLVGETRDRETAKTVVEAALTGHLVFTTLHTNSAAAAFIRLFEMEVEPFLISSSALGVIAQRLARKLCDACREPYPADEATCTFFGLQPGATLYRAKGCAVCNGRGLRGRVGIYEVLQMTPALRTLVARRAPAEEIHVAAVSQGMVDLKHYAAGLLLEGRTSVEEVMQVVSVRD